jgi:hypothetical protein
MSKENGREIIVANIEKIKETLNTLRVLLTICSAFIIILGGALGSMIKNGISDYIFWLSFCLFELFLLSAIILLIKIVKS